jgi:hypothetical protein
LALTRENCFVNFEFTAFDDKFEIGENAGRGQRMNVLHHLVLTSFKHLYWVVRLLPIHFLDDDDSGENE